MALIVSQPFPMFVDTNGLPLDSGNIYIGTVNLNPVTNPIVVYWDAELTLPAAQPIKTLNGYPARNGAPANIYIDRNYSIAVTNKSGSLIFYSSVAIPNSPGFSTDTLTGDGVTVDFTLASTAKSITDNNVYINGVYQQKDSYTILGTALTFSEAPPYNSSIEVNYY